MTETDLQIICPLCGKTTKAKIEYGIHDAGCCAGTCYGLETKVIARVVIICSFCEGHVLTIEMEHK